MVPFLQLTFVVTILFTLCLINFWTSPSTLDWLMKIFIQAYMELVTQIWCIDYFNIINGIKKAFKDLYEQAMASEIDEEILKALWSRYLLLFGVIKKINTVYGVNALFCFCFIYIWQMHNIYSFIHKLLHSDIRKVEIFISVSWICIQTLKLIILVYQPTKCLEYVEKFRARIAYYPSENSDMKEVRKCLLFSFI